ncbi:hypothetical protein DFQ01_101271 [Paenibacillus cellulosilyticus]|uniref:Uncharacterized protein n=1 Tax=Paenibacillus cellulosilyticus TaxID=375489 RepID=A0A2V2YZV7_9BACL|nr:hypothetical protein DFQ01_101271 [Paenibacillus cellulosilyticus]
MQNVRHIRALPYVVRHSTAFHASETAPFGLNGANCVIFTWVPNLGPLLYSLRLQLLFSELAIELVAAEQLGMCSTASNTAVLNEQQLIGIDDG